MNAQSHVTNTPAFDAVVAVVGGMTVSRAFASRFHHQQRSRQDHA